MAPRTVQTDITKNKAIKTVLYIAGAVATVLGATTISYTTWGNLIRPIAQTEIKKTLNEHIVHENAKFEKIDNHYIEIINRLSRIEGQLQN